MSNKQEIKETSTLELGVPKTIGELKRLLKDYPDYTPLCFRNQPRQRLYEVKTKSEVIIAFQQ